MERQTEAAETLRQAETDLHQGHPREALRRCASLLQRHPDHANARFALARALLALERPQEALPHLEDLCRTHPRPGAPHLARAVALTRLGRLEEAARAARAAARHLPGPAPWHHLGEILHRQGRLEEAEAAAREALARDPQYAPAWLLLGQLHLARDDPPAALRALRPSLSLAPHLPGLALTVAETLRQAGAAEAALALLLARADPADPDWWTERALAHQDLGQHHAALEALNQACARQPQHPRARWNRALAHLRLGALAPGWRDYAWGAACGVRPPPPARPWRGLDDLRPVWVLPEQGIGDEIQFAGCLTELGRAGIRCHWQGDPRLAGLLGRAHPGMRFSRRPPADPDAWAQARMGDLPALTRPHLAAFPRHRGYLRPDPRRVTEMGRWLSALGPGLKAGITWRAGVRYLARARRGIPFPLWAPLFRLPGIHWINLQHGDCEEERRHAARAWGRTIHEPPGLDRFADLDGLAALIQALDLVITVDNAGAHLTGALGRPGWVLLPAVADWRWFCEREDSPWYPSLRLFRQPRPGDWPSVMKKAAAALAGAARRGGVAPTGGG